MCSGYQALTRGQQAGYCARTSGVLSNGRTGKLERFLREDVGQVLLCLSTSRASLPSSAHSVPPDSAAAALSAWTLESEDAFFLPTQSKGRSASWGQTHVFLLSATKPTTTGPRGAIQMKSLLKKLLTLLLAAHPQKRQLIRTDWERPFPGATEKSCLSPRVSVPMTAKSMEP